VDFGGRGNGGNEGLLRFLMFKSWAPNLSRKCRSSDDKARYSKTLLIGGEIMGIKWN